MNGEAPEDVIRPYPEENICATCGKPKGWDSDYEGNMSASCYTDGCPRSVDP